MVLQYSTQKIDDDLYYCSGPLVRDVLMIKLNIDGDLEVIHEEFASGFPVIRETLKTGPKSKKQEFRVYIGGQIERIAMGRETSLNERLDYAS